MITNEELARRLDEISKKLPVTLSYASMRRSRILDKIIKLVKDAKKEQLLVHDPHVLIVCILRILLLYEDLLHLDRWYAWKRRRKFKNARNCYYAILKSYLPEKSHEIVKTIIKVIYEDQLWKYETFCFEIMCSLLDINKGNNNLIMYLTVNLIWNNLMLPDLDVEEARGILKLLYKLLDIYEWPSTQQTMAIIEKMLSLFQICIISLQSDKSGCFLPVSLPPLMKLKKSLEICLRNIIRHLPNDQVLVFVQHMCSWSVNLNMTDEIILEFGSLLEYAAFIHRTGIYEQTLTPAIFPLLMEMIGSSRQLINLLGNRVFQYLLDRKDNRTIFDTPKIFFEHSRLDVRISTCHKGDLLFFKLHREILHDSLLKSLINHCDSRMNLETTYCTVCLIIVELPCGFMAAAMVCLIMNLQEIILEQNNYALEVVCHVHATIISVMSLVCWIHKAAVFYNYVNRIALERAQWAPQLNPPIQSQYNFAMHHILWNKPELFFVDWETRYGLWKCFRLGNSLRHAFM